MPKAGEGHNPDVMNGQLASFAQRCLALKYDGMMLRAWFDRISAEADPQVAAQVLVDVVTGEGYTLTLDNATLMVNAVREGTYWTGLLAPTFLLDVAGPRSS